MKIGKLSILNFIFVSLSTAPNAAYGQNIDTDIDLLKLQTLSESASQAQDYQIAMKTLRLEMKNKLLPNLWKKYQDNPNYHVGAISAKDLFQKLDQFNLFQNETKVILQVDPKRKSDLYLTNKKWGVINLNEFKAIQKTKSALVLPFHIFLGASGYEDENYQLSLGLLLEENGMTGLVPESPKQIFRENTGGFTGVGGGGDGRSLLIKIKMLDTYLFVFQNKKEEDAYCFKRWANPFNFAQDILAVEIESSSAVQKVEFIKTPSDKWRILVPEFAVEDSSILNSTVKSSVATLCLIKEITK